MCVCEGECVYEFTRVRHLSPTTFSAELVFIVQIETVMTSCIPVNSMSCDD